MAKPRAVVISPEAPYPMWGGGALRTASILNYLAGRYSVDLVLFREGRGWDPSAALPGGLAGRTLVVDLPVHSRGFAARVFRNAGRLLRNVPPLIDRFAGYEARIEPFLRGHEYELAVIEHFWCAPYEPLLRRCAGRVVLDLHNVESRLHERYGAAEGGVHALAHSRFASAYARLEKWWIPRFDGVLVPSEAEALWPNAVVYPNALPFTETSLTTRTSRRCAGSPPRSGRGWRRGIRRSNGGLPARTSTPCGGWSRICPGFTLRE